MAVLSSSSDMKARPHRERLKVQAPLNRQVSYYCTLIYLAKLAAALENRSIKPWFNPFARIGAGLVRGVPWLEDLNRFPRSRIRVEFLPREPGENAVELYQETIYSLFRQYGKITEITSQPRNSPETPRFAYVDFALVRDAIMARNCLHGLVVGEALGGGKDGTKLRISFERKIRPYSIWNWLTSHPRLVIPVIAALLAATTVAIFDPIRKFFIKAYVKHKSTLYSNRIYGWLKSQTDTLLGGHKSDKGLGLAALWNQRQGLVEQVRTGLADPSGTFIVVQGSRGSGRVELVEQALQDRKYILTVDCKAITQASGESGIIRKLAAAVGYRPVFSWANSMSSMIDLAVQSTTGVKAGFSETFEAQISKILHTTASALKEVALSGRKRNEPGSEENYLGDHPEDRTVVVVDNFLYKGEENKSGSAVVYEKVAEWAATLVQNHAAHVVFLTNDSSFSKVLSRVLPDRAIRHVPLGDVPLEVARNFILSRLDENGGKDEERKAAQRPDLEELDTHIRAIGGRLADLETLATRIKSGQSPAQAVDEIVNQSASEIVKNFVLKADAEAGFSVEQAWWLIKTVAERGTLSYDEALVQPVLSTGPASPAQALDALAASELISLTSRRGFPVSISAGRPIYEAAFKVLASDSALRRRMDRAVLQALVASEKKKIVEVESELALLGGLPEGWRGVRRAEYLRWKLGASQRKVEGLEAEMGKLDGRREERGWLSWFRS